ncbi:MAG: MmgE/PrpD family protein [Firmicutes bacterium]|nr:MmgE/PrpD family protein [Bacillota bacterium]
MDASSVLADFFLKTRYEDLPQNLAAEVKKQVLDYIGVAIAGACQPVANEVRELYEEIGGAKQAVVWGSGKKMPVINAAQINATIGHCLDFDDVHEPAVMHPGVISIPTVLAVGDYVGGITGKELITGIALGGDMICRMSLAAYPGKNKIPSGWHCTTLNGSMVSANLTAKILDLNPDQAVSAIGIAYHQASGNGQTVKDGALTKRLGPGFAVRNGITSALLARKGVTGARNTFSGDWGFAHQYHHDDWDNDLLVGELGERWESSSISIKPYPCCRGLHHFCDIALEMYHELKLDPNQIERIRIWCGPSTMPLLGTPLEIKAFPRNVVESQFSIAWGVVAGLATGQVTLQEYMDNELGIHNPEILALSKKIVSLDEDPALALPGFDGGRVEVTMKDGAVHTKMRETPKGTPDDPLTFDDVLVKFRGCLKSAERHISPANADQILELVTDLENLKDTTELTKLIVWEN